MVYRIDGEYALRDIFRAYNRDYYTLEAYNYMIEYFDEIGKPDYEVDVIELCGIFSEYDREEFIEEFIDDEACEDVIKYYDVDYGEWADTKIDDGQDEDDLDPEQYFEDVGITDTVEEYVANDDDLFDALEEHLESYMNGYYDGMVVQLDDGNLLVIE